MTSSYFQARPSASRRPLLSLALVLVLQAAASLTLWNVAFQDEGLYLHTGRWMIDSWNSNLVFDLYPEAYFSGAPQFYPVIAGWIDSVVGLAGVRAVSTVLMLLATVFVYKATTALFRDSDRSHVIAIFAASTFAFCASVLFVGHFATFDAPSYCALTAAFWFAANAARNPKRWQWAVATGIAVVVAVLFKYASLLAVPFVFLAAGAATTTALAERIKTGAIAAGTALLIVLVSVFTWAGPLWDGFVTTTANRDALNPASPLSLLNKVIDWAWIPLAVALGGFIALVRRRALLAASLLGGSITCVGLQILSGEDVSLQKHVVLSLIFAAPLAGYLMSLMWRRKPGRAVVALILAAMIVQGVTESRALFANWPDTRQLVSVLGSEIRKDPNFRILADNPESIMYSFYDQTFPRQWVTTYEGSFDYQGNTTASAYDQALEDGYFDVVVLDGYTDVARQIQPKLAGYGYIELGRVQETKTYRTWTIYGLRGSSLPLQAAEPVRVGN